MAYTPPNRDAVNFSLASGYSAPARDAVDFSLSQDQSTGNGLTLTIEQTVYAQGAPAALVVEQTVYDQGAPAAVAIEQTVYGQGAPAALVVEQTVFDDGIGAPDPLVLEQTVYGQGAPGAVAIEQSVYAVGVPPSLTLEIHVANMGAPAPMVLQQTVVQFATGAPVLVVEQTVYGEGAPALQIQQRVYSDTDATALRGWGLLVWLNGVDVSDLCGGEVRIEAVEGESRQAYFEMLPADGGIDPGGWFGRSVIIDHIDGTAMRRIFTGTVDVPDYDPNRRRVRFRCSANRDEVLDKLSDAEVDSLVGGRWSRHIFGDDPKTGSQRVAEQQRTVAGVVELDAYNRPRYVDYAAGAADQTYTDDDIARGSIAVQLAPRTDLVNAVDLEFSYRYQRLRHRERDFSWEHPAANSWCLELEDPSTRLPVDTIRAAAEGSGWVLASFDYAPLPASANYNCGGGPIGWVISETERQKYALTADFTLATRFTQSISEDYKIRVQAPQSQSALGDVIETQGYGMEASYEPDDWEQFSEYEAPAGALSANGDWIQDKTSGDEIDGTRAEMQNAIEAAIAIERCKILRKHRKNNVSFELRDPDTTVDLSQTVQLNSGLVQAKGKLRSISHVFDVSRWSAKTRLTLAISKAGSAAPVVEDAVAAPAPPSSADQALGNTTVYLDTHLGNHYYSPPFSEEWSGMIGNYLFYDYVANLEVYEEQFIVKTPSVSDADRVERKLAAASTYNVEIPDDLLVIN